MPTLTFTLSAEAVAELTDAFGAGYQSTINGQLNPETKVQFARRQIAAHLRENVILHRRRVAMAAIVTSHREPMKHKHYWKLKAAFLEQSIAESQAKAIVETAAAKLRQALTSACLDPDAYYRLNEADESITPTARPEPPK